MQWRSVGLISWEICSLKLFYDNVLHSPDERTEIPMVVFIFEVSAISKAWYLDRFFDPLLRAEPFDLSSISYMDCKASLLNFSHAIW